MLELSVDDLETALETLGLLLKDRGLYFEVVAIGGGGLLLIGQMLRTTKDLDLVALIEKGEFISAKILPQSLVQAIQQVGVALNLREDWINGAPSDLFTLGLPEGFKDRMQTLRFGGLTVHLAGRFDQICFKLYATIDHDRNSKHFTDLKFLNPSEVELEKAKKWCITHDVSEEFFGMIDPVVLELRK